MLNEIVLITPSIENGTQEEEKKVIWKKEKNIWKKVIVIEDTDERKLMKEEEACKEKKEIKEGSTKQKRRRNTLENFKFVRTMVKKIEKPTKSQEETKKEVKEKRTKCLKKITGRKTSLSTPKKAKTSFETRPYSPKISTPDDATKKGRGEA